MTAVGFKITEGERSPGHLRAEALHVRRLAMRVSDRTANERLREYADELDGLAAKMEAPPDFKKLV